jgi:AraC-like DNA-binding protein
MSGPVQPHVVFEAGALFRGYLPSIPLRAFVELIWMVDGPSDSAVERVLPNGVVELILCFGPPSRVVRSAGFTRYRRAWIAGLQRGPLDIASEEATHLLGVRFRAGGAAPVFGVPMHELSDLVLEWEGAPASWVLALHERVTEERSDAARVALVEGALGRRLSESNGLDRRVQGALRTMHREPAGLSVERVAREVGISRKHLVQLFRNEVGVSPKTLQRILRFQNVVRAAASERPVSWTEVAHRMGYADQAHLNHDFRALSGVTPRAYLLSRTVDPNHIARP